MAWGAARRQPATVAVREGDPPERQRVCLHALAWGPTLGPTLHFADVDLSLSFFLSFPSFPFLPLLLFFDLSFSLFLS